MWAISPGSWPCAARPCRRRTARQLLKNGVPAARENIAFGAKSTEFMAPPHHGFALMREAALRLANGGARYSFAHQPAAIVARWSMWIHRSINRITAPPLARRPCRDAGSRGETAHITGSGHLTALFGSGFVALYFSNNPRLPACLQSIAEAPPTDTAALRLVRVAAQGTPDGRTVVDELGQAWQRYDAREGTVYLCGRMAMSWAVGARPRRRLCRSIEYCSAPQGQA